MRSTLLFVFGTLLDKDLLELVCEQPVLHLQREPATLQGFEPRYVQGKVFPVLVSAPESQAAGEVIEFDDVLLDRLSRYERSDFQLQDVTVQRVGGDELTCRYFANIGFTDITDRVWTLEEWQRLHKVQFMQMLASL